METRKLSLEEMELVEGGGSCAAAIAVAGLSGVAIIGTIILAPEIWALPKTWYAAATLVAGNAASLHENC
jgi:hypothetical protein